MLSALALAGLALILLLALAFALPVRLRLVAGTVPAPRVTLSVALFAGVSPAIRVIDSARRRAAPAAPPRREAKRPKHRRGGGVRKGAPRGLPQLLRGLLAGIRLRRLEADGEFGLSDPAETGEIYGYLSPLIWSGRPGGRVRLDLRPDFAGPRLAGHLLAEVDISLPRLAAAGAAFAVRNVRPAAGP